MYVVSVLGRGLANESKKKVVEGSAKTCGESVALQHEGEERMAGLSTELI